MDSTSFLSSFTNRIASFENGHYSKHSKRQALFNLAICGWSADTTLEDEETGGVWCHDCNLRLKNWADHQLQDQGFICSMHYPTCDYYRPPELDLAPDTSSAVRVTHAREYGYVESQGICVRVGQQPQHKDFTVHEDLICSRSEFFKNAMNGSWRESDERMIPLPEDEPGTFALYLSLLYTDKLPVKNSSGSFDTNTVAEEYLSLSKLFVLAEKLMDAKSKEVVLAAMLALSKESFVDNGPYYPGIDSVQVIYEGTREDSPARRLLVQLFTEFGDAAFITAKVDEIPKDFLYDLSVSVLGTRPKPNFQK